MSLCLPQSSGCPESKLSWPSVSYVLWACLSSAGVSGCRACSLGSTSGIVIIPFVGCSPQVMGLNCTGSPLFPSTLLWFLLYIFSCRRSFLLVFWCLSSIVSLYTLSFWCSCGRRWVQGLPTLPCGQYHLSLHLILFFPHSMIWNELFSNLLIFFFCQIASVVILFVTFSIELLYFSTPEFPFGTFFNSHFLLIFSFCSWIIFFISFQFSSVQFSHSVVSDSLRPHELQHARPPCPSPTLGVHSNSRPLSRWCHPAISSSVVPFSCPQSLLASGSFPMSQLFTWGGQSTGVSASASFLPKKAQGWSPSEWTGWISLQSKGLSRVFSNTTVTKASILRCSAFFTVQLSHSYIPTGKTIALTRQTFVGKVMSLLFKMLSRLVITFLPRSKRLLISWLGRGQIFKVSCCHLKLSITFL